MTERHKVPIKLAQTGLVHRRGAPFVLKETLERTARTPRQKRKTGETGLDDCVCQRQGRPRAPVQQKIVVTRSVLGFLGEGKADATLRVGIDEEDSPPPLRERVAQVDGNGRLPDSSFLADQS